MLSSGDGNLRLATEIEAHSTCPKIIRAMHLWEQKHQTTITKATMSQS
jgi:hypothetical protein